MRIASRNFLTRVERRDSNREIARALGNAFRSGGILPPTGVANWETVAWASARAFHNYVCPTRKRGIVRPHSPREPGGVNPRMLRFERSLIPSSHKPIVAWASARAIRNSFNPTRQRGIFCSTNQTTTNRNNAKKSHQGRQIIAQRFNVGSQANAKRQVPPGTAEVNNPSPTRKRGIFGHNSQVEPGGVNPRMLWRDCHSHHPNRHLRSIYVRSFS